MRDPTEYPITIYPHKDTGISPVGVDFYIESYPNTIIGYRETTPYRFAYEDIVLITGPETPPDIMESMRRLEIIQKYEYVLTTDRRALEFASYLEDKNSQPKPPSHDHTNYG